MKTKMRMKLIFIVPLIIVLTLSSVGTVHAYYKSFVYEFDTNLRSKSRTMNTNDDLAFKFNSIKCRKGHKMKITVKHNVSWGPDTTLTRKWIPECGGKVVLYGHDRNTPVYFIMSKKHDGYWVRGTGEIYSQKR
jgi:hypothetical protein